MSQADFELGLDRFRNHYAATGQAFVDPDAKLLNWFTNPLQSKGNGHVNGQPLRPGSREDRHEAAFRASKALRDSIATDQSRGGNDAGAQAPGRLPDPWEYP